MPRAAHPDAMKPDRSGATRTAPPMMPAKFPMRGRYRSYILFGSCSLVFVVSSLVLLCTVWALGSGPGAWADLLDGLRNPIAILYHVVALAAFVFTGWRFFVEQFGKSQPPRIGPLKPPPRAAFPPMLLSVWAAASAAVIAVAWGIFP